MSLQIGTDIIEVERIRGAIQRHGERFLHKIFTENEQAYCLQHANAERNFAGRFAAKEAIAKALGTGFGHELAFCDIEICNDSSGKPHVSVKGKKREDIVVSISHCREYATATAIVQSMKPS